MSIGPEQSPTATMIQKLVAILFLAQGAILGQEEAAGPVAGGEPDDSQPPPTAIIGPVCDGTVPPTAPIPPRPDPVVLATMTKRIEREEPPPVSGMRPIRKLVTATVQRVEPSSEPPSDSPPPADGAGADPTDSDSSPEIATKHPKPVLIRLSATVYDRRHTFLRWHPDGRPDEELTAWSNLNWNHFSGFTGFTHGGRQYTLMFGLGNESTEPRSPEHPLASRPPAIPEGPEPADFATTGTPAFTVTKGATTDAGALEPITAMHALYQAEGPRLRAACEAREQAAREREAHLRAHPPEPQDVSIRYAIGTRPATPTP